MITKYIFRNMLKPGKTSITLFGMLLGMQVTRLFPAPPVFSDQLGRSTYYQSYENNYFASLRSFTQKIDSVVGSGRIPVIVLGDSTIRGTGAQGENIWTSRLQRDLEILDPAISVVNFAQNAGDLLAPYMFYHLYKQYPQAIFVWGWHHTNASMERHHFHFWLTSEIILRDGRDNPAVAIGLAEVPINATSPTEWTSLVMAAINIVAPYLDLGNHFRYWVFGNIAISAKRNPVVVSLASDAYDEPNVFKFIPKDDSKFNMSMSNIYSAIDESLKRFVSRPKAEVRKFLDKEFNEKYRDRLLLVMVDLNPFFAAKNKPELMEDRERDWRLLEKRMTEIPGLQFSSLITAEDNLAVDDFADLGHLSVGGQAKLAEKVSISLRNMPSLQKLLSTRKIHK